MDWNGKGIFSKASTLATCRLHFGGIDRLLVWSHADRFFDVVLWYHKHLFARNLSATEELISLSYEDYDKERLEALDIVQCSHSME